MHSTEAAVLDVTFSDLITLCRENCVVIEGQVTNLTDTEEAILKRTVSRSRITPLDWGG